MSSLSIANHLRLYLIKMNPRVLLLRDAFNHQLGAGFVFLVFAGRNQYGHSFTFLVYAGRKQYGQGLGDVLQSIMGFILPVAIKGAQRLLKAVTEAIK